MTLAEFEVLLDDVAALLTAEARACPFTSSDAFAMRVRQVLAAIGQAYGLHIDFNPHPHAFPDISLGEFGIEVKFTKTDSWRIVANSVFESTRDSAVIHIYVVFGKMGGVPEVRWGRYDDSVVHVRTTHVPRFEVEIGAPSSLFARMGVPYPEFCKLSEQEKMGHIRNYHRARLRDGERLWWLDDREEPEHSLPIAVRPYVSLSAAEKRRVRAEVALLLPQVVGPSRGRSKYVDAAHYLITYRGILAHQTRDMFSAGSVAGTDRGGNYVLRSLRDIESEMRQAAAELEHSLFEEYWGESVAPEDRISRWLEKADKCAAGWKPSEELFRNP